MSSQSGYFWVRRLHSLSGILLSIAFVLCFLIPFSAAIGGQPSFNLFATITDNIPLLNEFEIIFVFAPLLFHAAIGLSVIYTSQFNVVSYGSYRNWMYALERFTGILLVSFLAYHIYMTRLVFAFTGKHADFVYMQKLFQPTWVKTFYIVGIICAAFHIGNGISFALTRWGITSAKRAQDVAAMTMWVVTMAVVIWGIRIVTSF